MLFDIKTLIQPLVECFIFFYLNYPRISFTILISFTIYVSIYSNDSTCRSVNHFFHKLLKSRICEPGRQEDTCIAGKKKYIHKHNDHLFFFHRRLGVEEKKVNTRRRLHHNRQERNRQQTYGDLLLFGAHERKFFSINIVSLSIWCRT